MSFDIINKNEVIISMKNSMPFIHLADPINSWHHPNC